MIYFQSLNMYHMNNMKMLYLIHASMIVMNINKISYMKPLPCCRNDIATNLINRNININQQDYKGETPLHYCAAYFNLEIAELLLQKKAQINIIDKYGNNPLWVAVFNAHGDYRMVKLFLKYNANIQNKNRANRSPLDFAKQINDLDLVNILLHERSNNS